jgi:hypothetical protein
MRRRYGRLAVSHCGPLRREWTIAAFLRRAAANGLPSRSRD